MNKQLQQHNSIWKGIKKNIEEQEAINPQWEDKEFLQVASDLDLKELGLLQLECSKSILGRGNNYARSNKYKTACHFQGIVFN